MCAALEVGLMVCVQLSMYDTILLALDSWLPYWEAIAVQHAAAAACACLP